MTSLLPIMDDFDRGLAEIKKAKDKELLKGMQLISDKLKNTLTQKGLSEVEVNAGDVFDAEIHEAITQIPSPTDDLKGKVITEDNSVIVVETTIETIATITGTTHANILRPSLTYSHQWHL